MRTRKMKTFKLCLVWGLSLFATGCSGGCSGPRDIPTTSTRGVEGGACRSWPAPSCDPGLECRRGVCRGCGAAGEHCCSGAESGCDTGLTCEWSVAADNVACAACGHPGERCCDSRFSSENYCVGGAMCDRGTDTCGGGATGPCSGSTSYVVGYRDATGCFGGVLLATSNSESEATACATAQLAGTAYSVVPIGSASAEYQFCQTSRIGMIRSTVTVTAFSSSDAMRCAVATCIDCSYTTGACS